jgi:WD40 repeat protein
MEPLPHASLSSSLQGHVDSVNCIDINRLDKAASCGDDGTIVWNSSGISVQTFRKNSEPFNAVRFCPQEPNSLLSAQNKTLFLYDIRKGDSCVTEWTDNEDEINDISVSNSGQFAACCDDSGEIKIYDLRQRRLYRTLRRSHTNICSSAQFHPQQESKLVSGGLDTYLILWDFSRAKALDRVPLMEAYKDRQFLNPPLVHSVSFSHSGNVVAAALGDGSIGLFCIQGKQCLQHMCDLKAHAMSASQVVALPLLEQGNLFASGGNDGKILTWDVTGIALMAEQNIGLTKKKSRKKKGKKGIKKTQEQSMKESICASGEGGSENPEVDSHLVQSISHGSKINWLAAGSWSDTNVLLVADQTANISVYTFA